MWFVVFVKMYDDNIEIYYFKMLKKRLWKWYWYDIKMFDYEVFVSLSVGKCFLNLLFLGEF